MILLFRVPRYAWNFNGFIVLFLDIVNSMLLFTARDAHLLRIPYENHGLQAASPSL